MGTLGETRLARPAALTQEGTLLRCEVGQTRFSNTDSLERLCMQSLNTPRPWDFATPDTRYFRLLTSFRWMRSQSRTVVIQHHLGSVQRMK